MNKSYEEIEKERAQRIEKHINNKDLNIRVSWATNCAVSLVGSTVNEEAGVEDTQKAIRYWTEWFIEHYEEVRAREADKLVSKEEEEKPL